MKAFYIAAAAAALVCGSATAQNLVVNGGFENGYADWTAQNFMILNYGDYAYPTHSGTWSAATGCVSPTALQYCYLSQVLNTQAGSAYTLSFWVDNDYANPGTDNQQYRVAWGGQDLGTVNFDGLSWAQVTYTGLIASSGSTELALYGRNDPAAMFFDDVSVTAQGSAPEPASWAMMLGGFGLLGGAIRARRKTAIAFA
jgi:hypothetical protein